MYQLMMLPGTELNTNETREKFDMKTGFRILPRCFGFFNINNNDYGFMKLKKFVFQTRLYLSDYLKAKLVSCKCFLQYGILKT